eukprot:403357689
MIDNHLPKKRVSVNYRFLIWKALQDTLYWIGSQIQTSQILKSCYDYIGNV